MDLMSPYIRSEIVTSPEREQEILAKAKLGWTSDGRIRVLYVKGSPYERGYQHGALLREEVQKNLGYFYKRAVSKFHGTQIFEEAFERMRPHIPEEYMQEMQGLAHGAKLPLALIHHIHVLPEIGEWSGKNKIREVLRKMMAGEFATTCSNLASQAGASADGEMYVMRILDWGLHRISRLHEFPLIAINIPEHGVPSANIGWVGFLGAVSGMNGAGITLGEMGYGGPDNETLHGFPMPFLLRHVMTNAKSLQDVRQIISTATPTNSFVYLMSDGKTAEAELYVRDPVRFIVFKPGEDIQEGEKGAKGIPGLVYGGARDEVMQTELMANHGTITPEVLMKDLIPKFALKSNFQNVIYLPRKLQFWVANAESASEYAASQPYTFFDLGEGLATFNQ